MPVTSVFEPQSQDLFRGNLSLEAVTQFLEKESHPVSFCCVELGNNAAGGAPVSLQHLQELKSLLQPRAIPLVFDVTRTLENARFIALHEPQAVKRDLWSIVADICQLADAVTGSLAKDFGINHGGFLAVRDTALFHAIQQGAANSGNGLSPTDQKLINRALMDRDWIARATEERMDAVSHLHEILHGAGVPVVQPPGGHCLLIEADRIPQCEGLALPQQAFNAWLFAQTGIRAGVHNAGMQKNCNLNRVVRLALPLGIPKTDLDQVAERLIAFFQSDSSPPNLVRDGNPPPLFGGDLQSKFRLEPACGCCETKAESDTQEGPPANFPPQDHHPKIKPDTHRQESEKSRRLSISHSEIEDDIAIIGLAGRYPKADNLNDLWKNLTQGLDCISRYPDDRPAACAGSPQDKDCHNRWGGYLDGVDRFDSLFFNISPREARDMDPQERLFLETAWQAVEDAGYCPENLVPKGQPRNVGVFVGAVWSFYQVLGTEEAHRGNGVTPNSFHWSIANRVSYCMNLCGPSLTVDTACSSSLTAIHQACDSIRKDECRMAIAGGVNLDLHPAKYRITRAAGMLSQDGRCRSFGQGANGYVAGEGVGAVLLKPLNQAKADGDPIYGTIKASVTNHGGRNSGYAVPNPNAQARLIETALTRAGVDPKTIGIIEAHGTGTQLGDPVEIQGLTQAFEKKTQARQYCAIGSIKSNIGHLEAAAGIAGLTKLLLQMKYRQRAPSLHADQLNELIDFSRTPFFVQRRLEPWQGEENKDGAIGLRAGLSSFGAGGANVHMIIESHPQRTEVGSAEDQPRLFPLSAATEGDLERAVRRLRKHLEKEGQNQDLSAVAFTLQWGRTALKWRLAIIAQNRADLIEQLTAVETKKPNPETCFQGKATRKPPSETKNPNTPVNLGDLALLARRWVTGTAIDWNLLYGKTRPPRVSLPTYPFAPARHWIGGTEGASSHAPLPAGIGFTGAPVSPLREKQASTPRSDSYPVSFSGKDFVFADHLVAGKPTLPGVVSLELVTRAVKHLLNKPLQSLENVIWLRPVHCDSEEAVQMRVTLEPLKEHRWRFQIRSGPAGKEKIHTKGSVTVAEANIQPCESLALDSLQQSCTQVRHAQNHYRRYRDAGLDYGPGFRAVEEIRYGSGHALASLVLPENREQDFGDYQLHPSLLDSALQSVGCLADISRDDRPFVPFAIGRLQVFAPLPRRCTASINRTRDGGETGVTKFSLALTDSQGQIRVRIEDFSVRPASVPTSAGNPGPTLLFRKTWREIPSPKPGPLPEPLLIYASDNRYAEAWLQTGKTTQTLVRVTRGAGFEDLGDHHFSVNPQSRESWLQLAQALGKISLMPRAVLHLASLDAASHSGEDQTGGLAFELLWLVQCLGDAKGKREIRLLFAYPDRPERIEEPALSGFFKCLALEARHHRFSVVGLVPDDQGNLDCETVAKGLRAELQGDDREVRIDPSRARRWTTRWQDLEISGSPAVRFNPGVYLITGGLGGLGLIFARWLSSNPGLIIVLMGRSSPGPQANAEMQAMTRNGARVFAAQGDVSSQEDVGRVLDRVRRKWGPIRGVFHGAGTTRDRMVWSKTADDLNTVFAAKVLGTINLDRATQKDPLDFFVLLSSATAVVGNPGQCDYAYGNAFMDAFAAHRDVLRSRKKTIGKIAFRELAPVERRRHASEPRYRKTHRGGHRSPAHAHRRRTQSPEGGPIKQSYPGAGAPWRFAKTPPVAGTPQATTQTR